MTKEEASKLAELGERMVRMEVLLEAHIADYKANTEDRKELEAEVASLSKTLNAALNQGKGAKVTLATLILASGGLGAFLTNIIPNFTK